MAESWLPAGWYPGQELPIIPGSATDDIVQLIARRCRRGAPNGSNFQVEIIAEIVHAQRKLEESPTLPWFLRETVGVTIEADREFVPFSTTGFSIIRLQDDRPLSYRDANSPEPIEVHQEAELKILLQKYPGKGEVPKEFYVEDDVAQVRPIPTKQLNYVLRFYAHDTTPILGAATKWTTFFPDLIMNMAGFEIAWSLRDTTAADRFAADLQRARDQYVRVVVARDEAGQTHIMGDD